jgi:hypothetical protein
VTTLMTVRLAVAVMGIVVWAYAIKVDDARLRLAGIVMLAVSLALRFLGRRRRSDIDSAT